MGTPNSQTCLEIMTSALQAINVLAEGEPLDAYKATVAFGELQGMLDEWRLDGFLTDSVNGLLSFQLVPGQKDYTVGPMGDVVTTIPPAWIEQAFLTDTGVGRTFPVGVSAGEEFWRAGRSTAATSPYSLYCAYLSNFPTATIEFYPIPSMAITCTLVFPEHIAVPMDPSETLTLSPGFRNAVVYGLANRLCTYYPTQDPEGRVATTARLMQDKIRSARKHPTPNTMLDPACNTWGTGGRMKTTRQGLYDIKSNGYSNTL